MRWRHGGTRVTSAALSFSYHRGRLPGHEGAPLQQPVRTDFPWDPKINDARWWDEIPPRPIPLAQVGFAQDHVRIDGLLKHAETRGLPGWEGQAFPHAIFFEGRYWIVNGSHRTTVAVIRGEAEMIARVRAWPWEVVSPLRASTR